MTLTESNYVSRFYSKQHEIRGINSVQEIDELEFGQFTIYDRVVYQYLAPFKHKNVVELACGPGIFMRYLHKRGFTKTVGIELSEKYVELCSKQNFNIIQEDALKWLSEQAESSLDVIVAIDFIEHLDKQGFVDLLDRIHLALAPEGIFVAKGPCGNSPYFGLNFFNDITHETIFTTTATWALMKMCNLELVHALEEYPANILKDRWWKVPLVKLARFTMRKLIFWSTGCHINHLSPDIWLIAKSIKN